MTGTCRVDSGAAIESSRRHINRKRRAIPVKFIPFITRRGTNSGLMKQPTLRPGPVTKHHRLSPSGLMR